MRKIIGFRLGIFCIIALFIATTTISAIEYSDYTPSTIFAEFSKIETEDAPRTTDNSISILIHPMTPFSIVGQYLDREREISEDNKRSLKIFAETFNMPIVLDIYKYEILIRDADKREYWLPIQENFRADFHKEYYAECKLTLYLVISIIYDHKPLVLINEFFIT